MLDVEFVLDETGHRTGDANLDGEIDFDDFLTVAKNFGRRGGWMDGDFDCDGTVQMADFLTMSTAFNGLYRNGRPVH